MQTTAQLPTPHRCPWFLQFVLVNPLRRFLEPARPLLAPYVRSGMTVLEPGCGFGYFSLPLARLVGPSGHVHCLDVEPRAISRLRRRAASAGLTDRITAEACEGTDLGRHDLDGAVDVVVVMHVLHEFEDLPGFLDQAKAKLRSEGRMLVVEPKGHVTTSQFDAMMALSAQRGFVVADRPDLGRGHLAAVLDVARGG